MNDQEMLEYATKAASFYDADKGTISDEGAEWLTANVPSAADQAKITDLIKDIVENGNTTTEEKATEVTQEATAVESNVDNVESCDSPSIEGGISL